MDKSYISFGPVENHEKNVRAPCRKNMLEKPVPGGHAVQSL
jgi:hypothetical protein